MKEFIVDAVAALGVWGVALLMLVENVFPPIPSELIMPLAGYLSAVGRLPFAGAVIAGTVGSVVGAVLWYVVGRRLGRDRIGDFLDRHGRWLGMDSHDLARAGRWFDRHGGPTVLIGRLIPGVRTLISLPAGVNGMAWTPFLLYTVIGSALWTGILAWVGRIVGREFEQVGDYLGPVSWVVFGVMLALYIRRVIRKRKRS
jgi:membrane protein DedA with SNARE-associated domain